MQADPLVIFGILSGVLSVYAYLPYAADTLRGRTQPQRASWFIWSVLASISLAAQIAEGATQSLWFAGVQTAGTLTIFLFSIRRGVGGLANLTDFCVLLAATVGILLWIYTDSPAVALAISIGVSLLGGSITVTKAYEKPDSETVATWLSCFIASGFAIASVGTFDGVLLAYPVYMLSLNGAILLAIGLGRQRAGQRLKRRSPLVRA